MKFAYMLSAIAVAATLSACANNHNSNAANQAAPDPYGIASLSSSQQQPNVSGTINIRQRVALPPDAVLTVTLSDASLADAPAHVLAQKRSGPKGSRRRLILFCPITRRKSSLMPAFFSARRLPLTVS